MSSDRYSSAALLEFIEYTAKNGLLKPATASSRKAAAVRILSVLDEKESDDLRNLDVDAVFNRFENMNAGKLKPDSLAIYRSRFKAALEDFDSWRRNPSSFKPSRPARSPVGPSVRVTKKTQTNSTSRRSNNTIGSSPIFPIPIRDDVVVEIRNLPTDLTQREAGKIAAVVNALAVSDKTGS